jgi:ankyrin repeat protein
MLKYLIERKGADMYIKYVNKDGSCGSNQQDLGLCMSNSNIFSHYLSRKKQNIEIIRYLLKQDEGKDIFISYKDGLGWTPIYHAFFYSSIEIVKLLIEKGGLNFKSHDKTPLIAKLEYEREIIKKTINKDAGQINAINDDGLTFLNEMCQLFLDYSNLGIVFDEKELKVLYDIVGFLLSKGADINEADNKGETPLLKLCKNSQFSIDMAKLLVQSGAKVSQECIENLNKNINGFEDLKSFLENTIKSYEIEQLPVEKDEK